jgi:hypothetical protein
MFRTTFIFVLLVQLLVWSLVILFIYALVFNPEAIGGTVAKIILGFQNVLGGVDG